jgi:hypothetical protein
MPEIPDFDQMAERLVDRIWSAAAAHPEIAAPPDVVEVLRQVWNARGAADMDAIDAQLAYSPEGIVVGVRQQIDRAIRTLDR